MLDKLKDLQYSILLEKNKQLLKDNIKLIAERTTIQKQLQNLVNALFSRDQLAINTCWYQAHQLLNEINNDNESEGNL